MMLEQAAALEVDQLVVQRGSTRIGPVTLQIGCGSRLALTGPTGAGKSSVLLAVAGLLPIRSGSVVIDGKSMTGGSSIEPWQRGISWLGQERGLWPHLTVEAQCLLVGGSTGKNRDQVRTLAVDLAIADLIDRRPGQLSGGEAQRAELLRAVCSPGSLLLLDEPFSAQNEAGRGLMKQLLDRECEQGRSLLLALHDIHEEIESVQIQSEI